MSPPFGEMPQRRPALPSITSSPPAHQGAGGVRGDALHMHAARHHVLGHAGAGAAGDGDAGRLVHTAGVVVGVADDLHFDLAVEADGDIVGAVGMQHRHLVQAPLRGPVVQEGVEFAQRRARGIERQAVHTYISSGAGLNTVACPMSGRLASERNSKAIAT